MIYLERLYFELAMKEREEYKKFWDKYKEITQKKNLPKEEVIKQKEILFIKNDMKNVRNSKRDYSKIIKYYKRKLVDYGAIREIKDSYKTLQNKYHKVRSQTVNV